MSELGVHFFEKFHVLVHKELAKSFIRPGGVGQLLGAFYGLQDKNQAILLVFHRC